MTSENQLYTYDGLQWQHGHESMRGGGIYKNAMDEEANCFISSLESCQKAAKKYHVIYAADLACQNNPDFLDKLPSLDVVVFSGLKIGWQSNDKHLVSGLAVKSYLNFMVDKMKKDNPKMWQGMWEPDLYTLLNAHYNLGLSTFQWTTVLLQPASISRVWNPQDFFANFKRS